jgi:aryl-alcohol dehydrogenase-like predicted oxidoreductase
MGMGAGSPYGEGDEAESIATVHAAIDRGVSLLDTGDFYGMGSSEMLVGQAIKACKLSTPSSRAVRRTLFSRCSRS